MAPFIAVSLLVAELFNKTATIQNVCILFAVALDVYKRQQLARLADYDGMDVMKLYDRQAVRGAQGKQKKEFER